MSPAISLFALACAALLGVAYGSGCSSVFIGDKTPLRIDLPERYLEVGQRDAVIDIPDNCALRGTVLVGEGADVCDYITAPDITLGPAFSPLIVHRTNALGERAPVNIVQYCRL
ncbi:uncharacterized protein [Choristoneura fumiferana]|uniref:uncharacterized protein n=1 Tax=Choristoneura fumiferana TaxID=7141 RepID=UPI003D15B8F2